MKINTSFMKYIIFSVMFILQIATSYALYHENKRANEAEQWAEAIEYQAEEMISNFYLNQK